MKQKKWQVKDSTRRKPSPEAIAIIFHLLLLFHNWSIRNLWYQQWTYGHIFLTILPGKWVQYLEKIFQLTFNMGKSTEHSPWTIASSLYIIALSWFVYFRVKLLFSSSVAIWASVATFTIPWLAPLIPMFHIWTWCGSDWKHNKILVSKAQHWNAYKMHQLANMT